MKNKGERKVDIWEPYGDRMVKKPFEKDKCMRKSHQTAYISVYVKMESDTYKIFSGDLFLTKNVKKRERDYNYI